MLIHIPRVIDPNIWLALSSFLNNNFEQILMELAWSISLNESETAPAEGLNENNFNRLDLGCAQEFPNKYLEGMTIEIQLEINNNNLTRETFQKNQGNRSNSLEIVVAALSPALLAKALMLRKKAINEYQDHMLFGGGHRLYICHNLSTGGQTAMDRGVGA